MDYALPFRRELIANASGRLLSTDEQLHVTRMRLGLKRARAIAELGTRWVLHSAYDSALHPHHRPACKESAMLKPVIDEARAEGRL